ncbi:hypothetical protein C8R44DRAFT_974295 [Mycena epipterygia]|nr:hypothetical protein C8R44DRAFT_974295 [Mycena epipterygia]
MIFKAISFVLIRLLLVDASSPTLAKAILPSTIDLSGQHPVSVTLINAAINIFAFTFPPFDGQDLEVLIGEPLPEQEYYPVVRLELLQDRRGPTAGQVVSSA